MFAVAGPPHRHEGRGVSTHEDWEKAREKRDRAAVRVAWAVAAGTPPRDKDVAEFAALDNEMDRITNELEEDES